MLEKIKLKYVEYSYRDQTYVDILWDYVKCLT